MKIEPIILSGTKLTLKPLEKSDIEKLARFCFAERIWRWYPLSINDLADLTRYVDEALKNQISGSELPFAIIQNSTSAVVGSSKVYEYRCR